ncbi:MAG TPA: site-2 protease family protein [Clostridiales bacterium]|jgi:regulator of sigma E protease|nr:site-2 protease family protein [Clostridiales bacterium]
MLNLFYIFLAILLFGILITVHELGHFFAARLVGIPVKEFAIGFGPALVKWKSKKRDTMFYLRAIPLGGYCMFYQEDKLDEDCPEDERAFDRYHVWKRFFTVVAGPLMNILLAFLVALIIFSVMGVTKQTGPSKTVVHSVNEASPAEVAGLLKGDTILSLNGSAVTDNLPNLIEQEMKETQLPLSLEISRLINGKSRTLTLAVTPLYSNEESRYMMGVTLSIIPQLETFHLPFGQTMVESARFCYQLSGELTKAFVKLFTRGEGINELTGFVGITELIVEETKQTKLLGYASMLMMFSINLGVLNLIPFPGLDGSRLMFIIIEAVRKKPVKKEAYFHLAGMVLLFGLMIYITFKDIFKLFR